MASPLQRRMVDHPRVSRTRAGTAFGAEMTHCGWSMAVEAATAVTDTVFRGRGTE